MMLTYNLFVSVAHSLKETIIRRYDLTRQIEFNYAVDLRSAAITSEFSLDFSTALVTSVPVKSTLSRPPLRSFIECQAPRIQASLPSPLQKR